MGEQTEGDPGAGTDVLAVNDGMVIGRDNLQDLASSLWPR
jgi:hypothetical protein